MRVKIPILEPKVFTVHWAKIRKNIANVSNLAMANYELSISFFERRLYYQMKVKAEIAAAAEAAAKASNSKNESDDGGDDDEEVSSAL